MYPLWLPRAHHCPDSSLPLSPGKLKPPTQNTQNSNLLASKIQPRNTLKNTHPAFISKEPCTKAGCLQGGFFNGPIPLQRPVPACLGFHYRFIIRHEIHSGPEFYFQARGLALVISSTCWGVGVGGKFRGEKKQSQVNFKQKQKKSNKS